MCGALPPSATFQPCGDGTTEDATAARAATTANQNEVPPQEQVGAAPAANNTTHEAWDQDRLPNRAWWEQLSWDAALRLGSTTFVQTPDRFRGAVLDARDKLLDVLATARQQGEAAPEWKAVLLLDVLLYSNTGQTSCAELLEERLAWFLGAQWDTLWAAVTTASTLSKGPRRAQTDKQQAARVHTLAAAGEEGRALAATGSKRLAPRIKETLRKTKACFPLAEQHGAPDRGQRVPPTPEL